MKLKRTILGPILVALFAFVSGGWLLQKSADPSALGADATVLNGIIERISRDYVDVHSREELYQMAVDGFLKELGDPHTNFMSAADYDRLRTQTTGEYGGLGIQIAERDGWITILSPLPDTPAERAGLLAGDRIIEVEGKSTEGWSDDDAVGVIKGRVGTPVRLKIARRGVATPIDFELVREEIHVRSVRTAYMIEPTVGYARLDLFSESSTDELRTAIARLRSTGMKGLILDLRANPGGLLDQGVSVSNLFVGPGLPIVETRARNPRDNVVYSARQPEAVPGMPMVVLVDQYSASAAEIVAGALQDHDRALVVGVPTYGKGSVQTLFNLSGGNYLKMTTGKWYTPSGRSIQKPAEAESEEADLVAAALNGQAGVSIGADGTPLSTDAVADTAGREQFRTDGGRIVYGGGGIVPDLIVRPDTLIPSEREFFQAISLAADKYWDTLFRFAVDFNRANPDLRPDFAVTPAMVQELFNQIRAEGVEVTLAQMQGARRLVDLHIGSQIAFAKWGQEGRAQRENRDDNVIRTAIDLLRRAPDQQTLFTSAAAVGASR